MKERAAGEVGGTIALVVYLLIVVVFIVMCVFGVIGMAPQIDISFTRPLTCLNITWRVLVMNLRAEEMGRK